MCRARNVNFSFSPSLERELWHTAVCILVVPICIQYVINSFSPSGLRSVCWCARLDCDLILLLMAVVTPPPSPPPEGSGPAIPAAAPAAAAIPTASGADVSVLPTESQQHPTGGAPAADESSDAPAVAPLSQAAAMVTSAASKAASTVTSGAAAASSAASKAASTVSSSAAAAFRYVGGVTSSFSLPNLTGSRNRSASAGTQSQAPFRQDPVFEPLAPNYQLTHAIPLPPTPSLLRGVLSDDETFAARQSHSAAASANTAPPSITAGNQVVTAGGSSTLAAPVSTKVLETLSAVVQASERTVRTASSRAIAFAHEKSIERENDLFMQHFPRLARTMSGGGVAAALDETYRLLGFFRSTVYHGVKKTDGYLAVTTKELAFASVPRPVLQAVVFADHAPMVTFELPWGSIASLQPAVALATFTGIPWLVPMPEFRVAVNALQVISTDRKVYSFLEVRAVDTMARQTTSTLQSSGANIAGLTYAVSGGHLTSGDRDTRPCLVVIDRAWRLGTTVPVPGVEYEARAPLA